MHPRMPEPRPTIDLGFCTAVLDLDSARYSSGSMRFTIADVCTRVLTDTDKKIGEIRGCIGGGVQFSFDDPDGEEHRSYFLTSKELWKIASEIDRRYLEQVNPKPEPPPCPTKKTP